LIRDFFRHRRLEQTFSVSVAFLVIVLIGTTMAVVHSSVAESLRRNLEARGMSVARSIGAVATPSLLAYNYAALQIAAEAASRDEDLVYVVIHDKEGAVAGVSGLASNGPPAVTLLKPSLDSTSFDVAITNPDGEPATVMEVAFPVRVGGVEEPWGTVRVGLSYAPVKNELRSIGILLSVLGFVLAVLAVIAGRWLARRITAPLRRLAAGTEALSAGDMSHRIPASGPREIADLARAFNVMMDRVQEKARESAEFQGALEQLNATLEEQVHERTRALEESEAHYKSLVEQSPDSILIIQDGKVCFVNKGFIETFGISEQDALASGFDLDRIFNSSSATLAAGRIAAWERGDAISPMEVLGRDAEGQQRHLELRGSRIEYRGRPAAECLLIDMTEAKRLREQLNQTEKLSALGELAGGVAHDFNNLLSAILGRVQLLLRRDFGPDVDRELEVIEKAARDGRETVRRIQEFSRTRRDKLFSSVNLGEVMQDSVEMTRTRWKTEAERRNVTISLHTAFESECFLLGNAAELREVFTNLILNSVDALPRGGSVNLSCGRDGEELVARVEDSGVGMTEEIRRHLFDPFFTTKGHSGTGLGLSVVYGIVNRHGGTIEVDSSVGGGTRFRMTFPAVVEIEVAGGDGAALPNLVRPGRILVIDDEPEIAELVKEALTAEGHTVETALCGTEGVSMAAGADFDLVFTDLGMPDMSGWDVARQIRADTPRTPIVLVTGWGATLDEKQVRRSGIAAVVHKPFDLTHLVQTTVSILAAGDLTGIDQGTGSTN
jgi:PAS domain S-box-containing protein